ncbi:trypsin inhibitor-like cysteine-rich domain-containing protein [Melittangium boletus]|uniref:EGF-like domain-containing protein n=1 Tax=Melittangium boletus DSM 14713 TaxID=1294270 RepID=A0A250IKL6_9BACT|nr:trypsin inhibitor-like cysteine-rich domain-containing protein [Melittangium boletus]ATB31717.1 hypothetical protein MEBOL_005180 [Melittangium boletus DSM 14713]
MRQTFKFKSVSLALCAWALAVGLVSCSGGNEAIQTQCEGVVCGSGRCEVSDGRPVCACEPGHHAEGLTCMRDDAPPLDPCAPNPCVQPGRGQCSNVEGKAVCACDSGKVEDGSGQCVSLDACTPNPCTAPHKTDCAEVEGQPVCACVSGYVPEGEACVPSSPDDHGDIPSEASPVLIDAPPTGGAFERAEDVDLFSFQAQAGHIYAFTCNPGGGAVDCHVSLSDAAGQVLAVDNNGGTGFIVHEYTSAGTYYFRVSSGQMGTYTYRLEDLGVDDHGDTRDTATASTPGASATPARLEAPGDVDFLKFGVGAGLTYSFTCTSTAFACAVELQDAAGTVLASGTASADTVTVQYTASAEDTLYVRLAADSASAMGAYSWRLEAASRDDHGDDLATATALTPSSSALTGRLERVGDVDVFSFQGTVSTTYEFSCTGTAVDCDVVLVDASGTVLQSDTGPSRDAKVTYLVRSSATYFVKVSGGTAELGTYTYRLQSLGSDDHGDTRDTSTPVTPSSTYGNARINFASDVDVFSFSAVAHHVYELECSTGVFDCNVVLTDAAGNVIAQDTTGATSAKVRAELDTADTYYFQISSGGPTTGAYSYRLQDLGLDDHGDTAATATALVPATSFSTGQLETPGDQDWFSFSGVLNTSYAFTCTSTAVDCNVVLYDAGGKVVQSDTSTQLDAKVTHLVRAPGTFFVKVSGGTAAFGSYTYRLSDLGVDDHGDTPSEATPVTSSSSSIGATLHATTDVDVFSFEAAAGHIYELACNTSVFDCDLVLLDALGVVVTGDTTSTTYARVRVELNTPGTYYFRIQPGDSKVGAYTYRLQDLGVDDHGDTMATATPITPGTSWVPAQFEVPKDEDWFSFTATAGHIYDFGCSTSSIDCDVYVLDAEGTVVASDTSTASRMRRKLTTGGTFYLRLVANGGWNVSYTSYSYLLQDLGVDDHGDMMATATPITPGTSWVPAQFEVPKDEDWFSFTATAGHIYDFGCSTSSIDCDVYVLDSAGTVVVSDTSLASRVRREFTTGGTFYLRLVANGGWNISYTNYSYLFQDVGMDDHGNTMATATPITPGTSWVPARFEVSKDEDWFSFTATAGRIYEFGCDATTIDCNVYVLDAAGTVVASDTSTAVDAQVRRKFTTGGTFYIRVVAASAWNPSVTNYSYRLQDLGVDDHADTFSGATVLTLGTATSGNLEFSGDVDFFEVNLAASTAYTVTTTGISTTLTVYAPDKTTVISSGSSPRAFTSNAAGGAHYVRVSGSSTGAYTLKVQ